MSQSPLILAADEREFLRDFLEHALKDARVEEHRTRNLNYRERVQQKEDVIARLLQKLGSESPAAASG